MNSNSGETHPIVLSQPENTTCACGGGNTAAISNLMC
jgi:hypothetical protein